MFESTEAEAVLLQLGAHDPEAGSFPLSAAAAQLGHSGTAGGNSEPSSRSCGGDGSSSGRGSAQQPPGAAAAAELPSSSGGGVMAQCHGAPGGVASGWQGTWRSAGIACVQWVGEAGAWRERLLVAASVAVVAGSALVVLHRRRRS